MKATSVSNELGTRATEALKTVLHQVSTIELKRMELTGPDARGSMGILVRLGVLGHQRTLACKVMPSGEPRLVREALQALQDAGQLIGDTIPVFIAPQLSAEVQAMCMESKAGFIDLQGNARLTVGEVFISKRSLPSRARQAEVVQPQAAETVAAKKASPSRAAAPVFAFEIPAVGAA